LPPGAFGQGRAEDLFQQALRIERISGDLEGAIRIYQQVVDTGDRALGARALIRIAESYEKLGQQGSKDAYARIIQEFSDQTEQVALARARLSALSASAISPAATGPTARRLWSGGGVDASGGPTWDGRLLTFVDWTFGDLAVRDLTRNENRLLTNKGTWGADASFPLHSTPSPDGRRVAYGWWVDVRPTKEVTQSELRLMDIDGGEPRVLFADPEVVDVEPSGWSPDGEDILTMLTRRDHTTQIALISATDGTVRILKTLDSRGPGKMSFSPDGKYIVYDFPPREDAPQRDIYVLEADGNAENALIQHSAHDVVMGWAPDGKHILFASDRTGDMSAWLAPVDKGKPAGEPRLVRRDAEFAAAVPMGFMQDGGFLYGINASATDLYELAIDPSSGRATGAPALMVDHFVGANRGADWTRDGAAVVYNSKRQSGPILDPGFLIVRTLATGLERSVPARLDYLGSPRWSPDGRYIVGTGRDQNGRRGIFRVDPQSGEATQLVEGGSRWLAGWSADAESIIYWTQDQSQKSLAIVRQRLDNGESKDLVRLVWTPKTNLYMADVSPDGMQVAFASFPNPGDPSTLQVVSSDGGGVRQLFQAPRDSEETYIGMGLTWSADSRYIFFILQDGEKSRLMRVPATGGPPQETGLVMDGMISQLSAHPDGQRFSITAGSQMWEVWIMENFLPKAETTGGGLQR
jgi:Tol biopolymer transport system component